MICDSSNLLSGYEEIENVKQFTDRQADKRLTNSDQKNLFKLLAQMI